MGETRTAAVRQHQMWGEEEARRSLTELARSGQTIAEFARRRGISAQRVYYWKKRLAETRTPAFVAIPLAPAGAGQIEIVADGITIRVREDLDLDLLVEILEIAARRNRGC